MPITSGFGIATYPTDALTADALMHVADERLRAAKQTMVVPGELRSIGPLRIHRSA